MGRETYSLIMKKLLLIFSAFLCLSNASLSQDYSTGIGFRGGYASGLTVKHFLGSEAAFEGIAARRWNGYGNRTSWSITGLYELHISNVFDVRRMNFYYGAGAHIGFWRNNDTNSSYTVIGVDGIVGLEYNFTEAPINISIDWKPAFNLFGHSDWGHNAFGGDEFALSIRYIFE